LFEILPESTNTCIGINVRGELSTDDYAEFLPKLDEAIEAQGKINLVFVMGDFEGWAGMDAAKADYKFGTQEYRHVERAAFVGDKTHQKWMVKIMSPFTRHTQERFFESDQLEEAWQWAREEA
jgi:hypothetical protein